MVSFASWLRVHVGLDVRVIGFGMVSAIIFGVIVLLYMGYHIMSGRYSLTRVIGNEPLIEQRQEELRQLQVREAELENLTRGLGTQDLDIDLLEEQARKKLYYLRPDEIIVPHDSDKE